MDAHSRLSYYKRLIADKIELSAAQLEDYYAIVKERGEASAEAMPASGDKEAEAKRTL